MGYGLTVMNGIRSEGSEEYQNRIPEATRENLINIGMSFQQYTTLFNEFVTAFFNKIGKTTIEQKMFENKLKRFKGEMIHSGKDIEEIFVEPDKAEGNYDPNGPNPYGRRKLPEVQVAYHRKNREYYFAKSIGEIDFLRVFQSEATLEQWMASIINSMYIGDELDEWYSMKNILATYGMNKDTLALVEGLDGAAGTFSGSATATSEGEGEILISGSTSGTLKAGDILSIGTGMYVVQEDVTCGDPEVVVKIYPSLAAEDERKAVKATGNRAAAWRSYFEVEVPEIKEGTQETAAKQFLKTVRKLSADISYPSKNYNMAGVTTFTKKKNQVLFIHKDVMAECDVEVLAKLFNLGKADIETQVVELDDFGDLDKWSSCKLELGGADNTTYALLVDDDFFRVHDTLVTMRSQGENAQGLFTNWFFHHHQILSASPFKNAVRFYAKSST